MKKLTLTAWLVGASLLPLTFASPVFSQENTQAASTNSIVPDNLTEEQLGEWVEKLNAYTKLYNETSRVSQSWSRYKSWVKSKDGPTGKEKIVYGLYSVSDSLAKTEAPKAIEASKQDPKMGSIDTTAVKLSEAVIKLDPILKKAYDYYNRKDYTDDKFALGKEMHPALSAAFTEAVTLRETFDKELTAIKDNVDLQFLNHLEKTEGKKYKWQKKNILMASQKAVEALQNVSSKSDLPSFSEAIKKYAASVREFDDYMAGADDIPTFASAMKSRPASLLSYLRSARESLEKNDITWFNNHARSAVSEYNTLISLSRH
ncbi:DUF3829 domain-containing protein [Microvirga sp. W0021]|uniref:DUF3829 domain-containing protein n=1 Tax=Hohaiivirga grylli TaxID=3133970 RepID=A0ABV0BJ09_9HYPH